MTPEQFQSRLLAWFDVHGRKDLPWQQDISPYRVWVSEIMLQQTQVASVIAYFNRFMARFPALDVLAKADLDEVLQHWSGLGYYARARNLHKTAQIVAANGGQFPQTIEQLSALPGIGRSTAGAILSIACGQSQPILDGNVKRVLSRFHAVSGWPGDNQVAARLWQIATDYTPGQRCGAYTQAMMDLGATLCTRSRPLCELCPVRDGCLAEKSGLTGQLPEPKPRKTIPVKHTFLLVLTDTTHRLLLERRPPAGIWGGLWSLPEFDDLEGLRECYANSGCQVSGLQLLPRKRHTFSHFHLEYTPVLAALQNPINNVMEGGRAVWYNAAEIKSLGLPAPIKRLLQQHYTEVDYDKND